MALDAAEANRDLVGRVVRDPRWARRELSQMRSYAAGHGALYGGRPIPFPVVPHFVSPAQRRLVDDSVAMLVDVLERFIEIFLADEDLQRLWAVSQPELDLYRIDPGYRPIIQVARFDGLLAGDRIRYLEFNCDSPGGNGDAQVILEAFRAFFARNGLDSAYEVWPEGDVLAIERAVRDAYDQWRARPGHHGTADLFVVVTDWRDNPNLGDIRINDRWLNAHGIEAAFADPRELEFDGQALRLGGRRVDVVYKRVIVHELLENPGARALFDAYRAGATCVVNAPRSVIAGNKKVHAALRMPDVQRRLSKPQRQAVEAYLPWTQIVRDARVEWNGRRMHLRDLAIDHRHRMVLKACRSYGGRDVLVGFDTPPEQWAATVDDYLTTNDWILQELAAIPSEPFAVKAGRSFVERRLNVNINPVLFGGRCTGSYSRVSDAPVINVSGGGGMVPTFVVGGV